MTVRFFDTFRGLGATSCTETWESTAIFISSGGPQAHGNSVESHVIPAKAGTQLVGTWTPACAGVTKPTTFMSMGGPQAHDHSG
jgi:hypothetical protein